MSDAKGSGERQRPRRPGQASGAESAQAGLPASAWLAEMIAERRMSQVRPNMARSGDLITQARTHIGSARKIASTDSTLALAACHDAIRKALDAHAGAMDCGRFSAAKVLVEGFFEHFSAYRPAHRRHMAQEA